MQHYQITTPKILGWLPWQKLGLLLSFNKIISLEFPMAKPILAPILALLLMTSALVGCSTGYRGTTSGAASNQAVGDGLSNQQYCVQSCDNAHARCTDGGGARRETDSSLGSVFGSQQDCAAELRKCLPQCQAR